MVAPLWALNTIKKFVFPEKVGQSSPKFFRGCYPLRPLIMPNFIEIGQTSLEKSVKKRYLFGPSRHFFCHRQKRDYLSRACSVREARLIRVPGLSCSIICVILRSAVLIRYRSVTDTQTDMQTHYDGIYRA